MHMPLGFQLVFDQTKFSREAICCPNCSWSGSGQEAEQELLLLSDAVELFCPECEQYLGFVSLER